jgi:hypothetical protein
MAAYLADSAWSLLEGERFVYVEAADGAYVYDADSEEYIAYTEGDEGQRYSISEDTGLKIKFVERAVASINSVQNIATSYNLSDNLVTSLGAFFFTYNDGMVEYSGDTGRSIVWKQNSSTVVGAGNAYIDDFATTDVNASYDAFGNLVVGKYTMTVSFAIEKSSEVVTYEIEYTVNPSLYSMEIYEDSLDLSYFLNQAFNINSASDIDSPVAQLLVVYRISTTSSVSGETFYNKYVNIDDAEVEIGGFSTAVEGENIELSIEYDGTVITANYSVVKRNIIGLILETYVENANGDYVRQYDEASDGDYVKKYVYIAVTPSNQADYAAETKYVFIAEAYEYTEAVDGAWAYEGGQYVPYDESMGEVTRYNRAVIAAHYEVFDEGNAAHTGLTQYGRTLSNEVVYFEEGTTDGVRYSVTYIPYDSALHAGLQRYAINSLTSSGNVYAVMEDMDVANYIITCIFDEMMEGYETINYRTQVALNSDNVYAEICFALTNFNTNIAGNDISGTISYGAVNLAVTYTVEPRTLENSLLIKQLRTD